MSKLKISQHFDKNANLGNYVTARIGITLEKEVDVSSPKEIEKVSNSLLKVCKGLIKKQLEEIEEEADVR